jgi:hypothetical protein
LPAIDSCLSFDGDSFRKQLVEICVSHNEEAEALVRRDRKNPERSRFPTEFPIGQCTANLQLLAALLRLADILDFDRERTPALLFHYLLPGPLAPETNRSVLEWRKHMAIAHWTIGDEVVFRGRCSDHVVHHAIVQFVEVIRHEIHATRATFGNDEACWPFVLPGTVRAEIHEEGYTYVPYRFELDDQRIYELLLGGAIYPDPLMAIRELIQNAVDACKTRDALTQLSEPYIQFGKIDRIVVRYQEPKNGRGFSTLTVTDTGTGMDRYLVESYFLRVGQSYYRSVDFARQRTDLRRKGLDFAPVSTFGIGFLSCFLLADRVEVTTAMWEPLRGDHKKRDLLIDGPTRLIRLYEDGNEGPARFKGTAVTLHLVRGSRVDPLGTPPKWEEVKQFIISVCQDLPYRIHLEYLAEGEVKLDSIDPMPLRVSIPKRFEAIATRIAVDGSELEGEIVLLHPYRTEQIEKENSTSVLIGGNQVHDETDFADRGCSELLRGGFKVGYIPGLPQCFISKHISGARIRSCWEGDKARQYIGCNLARTEVSYPHLLASHVTRIWLTYLLTHADEVQDGQIELCSVGCDLSRAAWLEKFSALTLYSLAKKGWHFRDRLAGGDDPVQVWEDGGRPRLWLGSFHDDIHWKLLDLVLPRVSRLQMGPEGRFYVTPPTPGWSETLRDCYDYNRNPVSWGPFVEYVDDIEHLLAYEYSGVVQLNSRYRDRLSTFTVADLGVLLNSLNKMADARGHGKQPELTQKEAQLVARAAETCGELQIGEISGAWPLGSFRL